MSSQRNVLRGAQWTATPNGNETGNSLQEIAQRLFIPRVEEQRVTEQTSRGLFIPYPLLAVILTLSIVIVSGLVALEVQVNNLSTTLLLRDADSRAQIQVLNDKLGVLQVYVQNDREKIVRLETQTEKESNGRQRHN